MRPGRDTELSTAPRAAAASPWWTGGGVVVATALLLAALAYANALPGAFVFDDTKQIAANPLVRDPGLLGKALFSDVWAYKGDEQRAESNYWRPAFVAWMSLNHALFGIEPRGWHVTNILLHALATILVWRAFRAVGGRPGACAFAAWIFAVHPVHVESVTWVSGAPDLLLAIFLLGAYLAHLGAVGRRRSALRVLAITFHAGAVLSKEVGIVFPALVFVTEWALASREGASLREAASRALRSSIPFALVSILFLIARVAVLGRHRIEIPGAAGLENVLLTAPQALLFYLRQALLPFQLGPTYAFAAVEPSAAGLVGFVVPALVVIALAAAVAFAARRSPLVWIGIAWFVLPLAPALDLRSFLPEDLVHDRYLYLALAGLLAIGGEAWVSGWKWIAGRVSGSGGVSDRKRRGKPGIGAAEEFREPAVSWAVALALALALVPLTRDYNRVWHDEVSLWERGTRTNPSNSYAYAQLGGAYRRAGRLQEAREALTLAIERNPGSKTANLSFGALEVREGRYPEAEEYLGRVLLRFPQERVAIDQLALAYQKQGKFDDAVTLFERGRRDRPRLRATYGVNIAVLHRLAGRAGAAISELESLLAEFEASDEHAVLRGWWYLGELYLEAGRTEEAKEAYSRYLAATATLREPDVEALRTIVSERLARLDR